MSTIVLIDLDNEHGELFYNLFNHYEIETEGHTPDFFINNLTRFKKYKDCIFCIPLAGDEKNKINQKDINALSRNNIIIAAQDDDYLYPWSFKSVVVANKSIQMPTPTKIVTGTSGYCAYLAILAVYVPRYVKKLLTR